MASFSSASDGQSSCQVSEDDTTSEPESSSTNAQGRKRTFRAENEEDPGIPAKKAAA